MTRAILGVLTVLALAACPAAAARKPADRTQETSSAGPGEAPSGPNQPRQKPRESGQSEAGGDAKPNSAVNGTEVKPPLPPARCAAGYHNDPKDPRQCVKDVAEPHRCGAMPGWPQCGSGKHVVKIDCHWECVSDACQTTELLCRVGEHSEQTSACGWNCYKDVDPPRCGDPTIVCPSGSHVRQNKDCSAICVDDRTGAAVSMVDCRVGFVRQGASCVRADEAGQRQPPSQGQRMPAGDDLKEPPDATPRPAE